MEVALLDVCGVVPLEGALGGELIAVGGRVRRGRNDYRGLRWHGRAG